MALAFLKAARRAGATVLAADPARAFVPTAELAPLMTYRVPVLPVLEEAQVKTVTIYSLPLSERCVTVSFDIATETALCGAVELCHTLHCAELSLSWH
jgi:hypothetical protein